jgi:hypothetical protein
MSDRENGQSPIGRVIDLEQMTSVKRANQAFRLSSVEGEGATIGAAPSLVRER